MTLLLELKSAIIVYSDKSAGLFDRSRIVDLLVISNSGNQSVTVREIELSILEQGAKRVMCHIQPTNSECNVVLLVTEDSMSTISFNYTKEQLLYLIAS